MKNLKSVLVFTFVLLIVLPLAAQNDNKLHREFGIKFGTSFTAYNETRYSAITKNYKQPKIGLVYAKWNDKKREEFYASYTSTFSNPNPQNLWYKIIHPEVVYSYQRKVANTWIGGYYHSSTLLNFPKNDKKLFGNNPISYTIANGLGIAINHAESLLENDNRRLDIYGGAKMALLNYVIRPSYGHPYPEDYLQEDVFKPTRAGMGKSVAKSGKFRTVDKYQSMKLVMGLNFYHKDHLKIGVQYERNFQKVREGKQATYKSHDFTVGISYLY